MSSPAGIMTKQMSQSDQIHLVMDVSQKLEGPDSPVIPAASVATEVLRNNNPGMALSSLGKFAAPHADARKLEGQLEIPGFKSQSDTTSTGIHLVREDEDEISQTRVAQDLALQQDDLAPTRRAFDVPCREVDSESMQLHTKLQSALRRVMELERRLGAMRDKRFLRRERIRLGLEISMAAGQRGVSASGFPSMMILLALIVLIIPCAYKYYAFFA